MMECYALGLGEPLPLSAEHGEGIAELYDALLPYETEEPNFTSVEDDTASGVEDDDGQVLPEAEGEASPDGALR